MPPKTRLRKKKVKKQQPEKQDFKHPVASGYTRIWGFVTGKFGKNPDNDVHVVLVSTFGLIIIVIALFFTIYLIQL